MLEVLSNFICSLIMCGTAFYTICKIIDYKEKILTFRNIILILIQVIVQTVFYHNNYSILGFLTIFLINISFYKFIFKTGIEESIISYIFYTIVLALSDIIGFLILEAIFSLDNIKESTAPQILLDIMINTICIIIINIRFIKVVINQFYKLSIKKRKLINNIFIILIVNLLVFSAYKISIAKKYNFQTIIDLLIMINAFIITYIFINNRVKYTQLRDEYSTLFGYVQNFEEWIERDQLNRHEYKNQLAVIRSITKDKSVIKKINDLLDDNIKIKGDAVYKLKELPTGGKKGLMYYKVAIAQKQNINIEVDVSLKRKSEFKKLNEHKTKVLSNLIGIYFDNAIEAALETEEKNVCLEVYEIKDGAKFVISNTFKRSENFDRRNERGVTSKGKGHGNGLYYANNLISRNNWLDASQEIIDNYYIQNIIIKN